MASIVERTKYGLDWLQHGYLLVQILGGAGAGQAIKAILMLYTRLSPLWITPIWLLASAIAVALLVWLGNKTKKRILVQTEPLVIHSAVWRIRPGTEVDVTAPLNKLISDNSVAVYVANESFGGADPAYGMPKHLEVKYSYGSHIETITRGEFSHLVLPVNLSAEKELERLAKFVEHKDRIR